MAYSPTLHTLLKPGLPATGFRRKKMFWPKVRSAGFLRSQTSAGLCPGAQVSNTKSLSSRKRQDPGSGSAVACQRWVLSHH